MIESSLVGSESLPSISKPEQQNSLQLRRLPLPVLLSPNPADGHTEASAEPTENDARWSPQLPENKAGLLAVLLHKTCLNPRWSLRSQLMLSFGSISILTIAVVVVICIVSANSSGRNVKEINQESLQQLFARIQGTLAPYLAESLTPRLIPSDVLQIVVEATRDRFAGYPNPTDEFVPFLDVDSRTNKYPVRGQPLPLDWQIDRARLVTEENHYEHVQNRWPLFDGELLNPNGYYFMRGECDPQETNSSSGTYWPNCTDANNNVTTGGVDAPSPTNAMIYRKASDLIPLLKALFEYHQDLEDIEIHFANSGAGSHVQYPHVPLDATATYVSIGCDWMTMPNPYDPARPIGTPQDINRCRPNGTAASVRVYNPLERSWCRDSALHPNRVIIKGPYTGVGYYHLVLVLSLAVYDRVTKEFIGAVALTLSLATVHDIVSNYSIPSILEVSLVRFDEMGTLVASSTATTPKISEEIPSIADIGVGVSPETYQEVWSMVSFDTVWDPLAVQNSYTAYKAVHRDGFQVSALPIPPIPDSYDVDYRPQFFVFLSLYENAINERIQHVDDDVDHHEQQVVATSVVLGGAGVVIMLAIILTMSHMITWPLRTMNKTARDILGSFGESGIAHGKIEVGTPQSTTASSNCIPETELSEVTGEFNKMVIGFSSSSMATPMRYKQSDWANRFTLQSAFRDLYQSRTGTILEYRTERRSEGNTGFVHMGSNIVASDLSITSQKSWMPKSGDPDSRLGSPLFVWITILIVIPLILTTVSISAAALCRISKEFQGTINFAEESYIAVELSALAYYARARADFVSSAAAASLRDLHLLTRYTSWLVFGALNRTDAFVDMISGQEPCKAIVNVTDCGYYHEHYACDCAWNDADAALQCNRYATDSRSMQKTAFGCQSVDAWPNGDRNSTSFPKDSYSPQTTSWWYNVSAMPGSTEGVLAGGYKTTYDRLRVASAIPMFQLLYNYDKKKELASGSYVAFEADGLIMGYSGCSTVQDSLLWTQWVSSESNGAAKLQPELCPVGKYGYDPRCREWYDTGRKLAASNVSPAYVTPPYFFADGTVAQTATAPFTDPRTKESVGQVLVDFRSDHVYAALQNRTVLATGGFPLLITVRSNIDGADTVIGPGFPVNEAARPIGPLVLPIDQSSTTDRFATHRSQFEDILASMRNGAANVTQFYRTSSDGSVEKIYIAYAPINATAYQPVNSSNFLRGVEPCQYLVYSLGLVETERGLLEPFSQAKTDTEEDIQRTIVIMTVVIFGAIIFLVYMSYLVTLSMTEPMIFLVKVLQGINRMDVDDDLPKLEWSASSRELMLFSETMDTLYKVMRAVNKAYFAGDLEKAYFVLDDIMTLFRRLGNERAIGVACNNLGNVMLALYRRIQETKAQGIGELSRESIIRKGITYYTAAIQLGEKAYEQLYEREGWTPLCLDFMQHLSNRYFNRAMFLLTVNKDHDNPDEVEKLGLRDIQISQDMDVEIATQGEDVGWGSVKRTETLFEIALVRARGHVWLQELGYPDDWELEYVLKNTYKLLMQEMKQSSSSLFREIGPIGRLQQLETVLIRYYVFRGALEAAARIAIRCLVEDEYTLPEAEYEAVSALVLYVSSVREDNASSSHLKEQLEQYLRSRVLRAQEHEDELPVIQRSISVPPRHYDLAHARSMSSEAALHPREHSVGGYVTMEIF